MNKALMALMALALSFGAAAKLPAPSDEAKAKAAEAAAKTAHGDKVAAYQLCKSREKVAAHYYKTNGKGKAAPVATPACVDPGAFVPALPAVAGAPSPVPPAPAAGAKPAGTALAAAAKKG